MHSRFFESIEQVEHVFARQLDIREIEFVYAYIKYGVKPNPNGCWHCTESEMLKLTKAINRYESWVSAGLAPHPREADAYGAGY